MALSPEQRRLPPLARRPGTDMPAHDVPRARIYRPAASVMQSARTRCRWLLEFDCGTPPTLDPLTGWTGGADPLSSIQISFPNRESAIAFAARNGWSFEVVGDGTRDDGAPAARGETVDGPVGVGEDEAIDDANATRCARS